MRNLVLSLACVAAGCTASRAAAVAVPPAACVEADAPAPAPVDPLTQSYQTAYSVCHSDPAFAASLYQQVVDRADPQSDLYSRASLRLDALQLALADRKHPEAARQACDQAARWARPTERIAAPDAEASSPAEAASPASAVQTPAVAAGPLPASWLPATAAADAPHGSACTGCASLATSEPPRAAGSVATAAISVGGSCLGPANVSRGVAGPSMCGAGTPGGGAGTSAPSASVDVAGQPAGAGTTSGGPLLAAAGEVDVGSVQGEWAAFAPGCSARGSLEVPAAAPQLVSPPLVAVAEPPLPPPPLVAVADPPLPTPPLVAVNEPVLRAPPTVVWRTASPQYVPARPPVRVVVSGRDPGAELVGAFLSVFGRPVVVAVPPPPPRRPH